MTSRQRINEIHDHISESTNVPEYATAVLNSIKQALSMRTDAELARSMSVAPKTIATWRHRNAFPYKKIIDFCVRMNLDLNQIFSATPNLTEHEEDQLELTKVFIETRKAWAQLDTVKRYELASKILRTLTDHSQ